MPRSADHDPEIGQDDYSGPVPPWHSLTAQSDRLTRAHEASRGALQNAPHLSAVRCQRAPRARAPSRARARLAPGGGGSASLQGSLPFCRRAGRRGSSPSSLSLADRRSARRCTERPPRRSVTASAASPPPIPRLPRSLGPPASSRPPPRVGSPHSPRLASAGRRRAGAAQAPGSPSGLRLRGADSPPWVMLLSTLFSCQKRSVVQR